MSGLTDQSEENGGDYGDDYDHQLEEVEETTG